MIVKYKAETYWGQGKISRMEFSGETDKFLIDRCGRHAKVSSGVKFCDTWAEAHAELTRVAGERVMEARRVLELANSYAGNVRGMKEPQ